MLNLKTLNPSLKRLPDSLKRDGLYGITPGIANKDLKGFPWMKKAVKKGIQIATGLVRGAPGEQMQQSKELQRLNKSQAKMYSALHDLADYKGSEWPRPKVNTMIGFDDHKNLTSLKATGKSLQFYAKNSEERK